jgi:Fic family protein
MNDSNWDLINGSDANDIEVLNLSNQVNVIEALTKYMLHFYKKADGSCEKHIGIAELKELHRTATLFLLEFPGNFRDIEVHVNRKNGTVFEPPPVDRIEYYLKYFIAKLEKHWETSDAVTIASYALWFINWVHPFKNGNGRSARAFAYACLNLKLGFILPGSPTVLDLILQHRDEYYSALEYADKDFENDLPPNLEKMSEFISRLLETQLESTLN